MASKDDRDLQAELNRLMTEVERADQGGMKHNRNVSTSSLNRDPQPTGGFLTQLKGNFYLPLQILAIAWAQEIIDQVFFNGRFNLPIHPRSLDGIPGIFLSAFSHANFVHLMSNSVAFLIFSWLILAKSKRDYWITFLMGWLGGGILSWLLGLGSVHGLSGVVYTLFGYLLVIGWLEKRLIPLLISIFVLINYSATIFGIFPTQPMVAWWGHLFGFVLGIVAAYCVYRDPQKT